MKEEKYLASKKDHNLLKETEAAKATIESKLEAQKAAEKNNCEPWYFTHS